MTKLIVTDFLPLFALFKMSTDERNGLSLSQYSLTDIRRMVRDPQFDNVEFHFVNKEMALWASKMLGYKSYSLTGGYSVESQDVIVGLTPLNAFPDLNSNAISHMYNNGELIFQVIKVDDEISTIDGVNLEYAEDARQAVIQYQTTSIITETEEVDDYEIDQPGYESITTTYDVERYS